MLDKVVTQFMLGKTIVVTQLFSVKVKWLRSYVGKGNMVT